MPLPQLQPRLAQLPLVLVGPMLRRTTATDATVFVALKAARKATLTIRETNAAGAVRATGTRSSVQLGTNLHVVAVTATGALQPGRTYVYNLAFGPADGNDAVPVAGTAETLMTPGVVAADANAARTLLTYEAVGSPDLPSFALAPASPADLRVVHASCRRPHGEGRDALAAADSMVGSTVTTPDHRPHLLLLTGDQIYGDDVADVLLAVAADAAYALLGWDEPLPTADGDRVASVFKPGERADLVADDAKLSTEEGVSHLLSFGEFCAMYLLAWGTAIWPEALPTADDFTTRGLFLDHRRTKELREVRRFWLGLPAVRRALANIPTLTMFDDHEVTDDWNLRGSWSKRVLDPTGGSKLGRRIVQNGLAAFAVFQAWGNTPERFAAGADGAAGRAVLTALSAWEGEDTGTEVDAVRTGLGMPTGFDAQSVAQVAAGAVRWHYAVTTPTYQLLALDTRTQRSSPDGEDDPAALLGAPDALQQQLRAVPLPDDDVPVLVISPPPVFGNPLMEWLVGVGQSLGMALYFDAETWGLQPAARERFLSALLTRGTAGADGVKRQRVVLLCGDVHYGFSARIGYSASITPDGAADAVNAAVAQLTSSPAKNESGKTGFLHWIGYTPFSNAIPRETVVGFANLSGDTVTAGTSSLTGAIMLTGTPAFTTLPEGATPAANADWRYDVEFLLADTESDDNRGPPPAPVAAPPPGNRDAALAAYLSAADVHAKEYVGKFGSGKEIVGRNTIGEVTFTWGEADEEKTVVHELWWALPDEDEPFPLSRWSISLANGSAAGAGIRLHVTDAAGNASPLANAWVYVREGATLTTLRTEADGRLVRRRGTERDAPWDYTRAWTATAGTGVTLAYTRGARPVPEAVLNRAALAGAFRAATIPALDAQGRGVITVRDVRIDVTRPADLDLWPLLWQSPDAELPWLVGAAGIDPEGRTYEKAGMPQRLRAYNAAGNLIPADGNAAAAPPVQATLKERAVRVEATVDAAVTSATVEVLDRLGAVVRQRDGFAPTAALRDTAPATLGAPAAGRRTLTANVILDHDAVANALGYVQVFLVCQTPDGPRIEAAAALLTGIQLSLVDDPAPAARGAERGEANDVVVVDFGADEDLAAPAAGSPQTSPANLGSKVRVRRMLTYDIAVQQALFDPALPAGAPANPLIPKPRMPRMMAELHLAGADRAALTDLMRRRWHRRDVDPATVRPVPLLELDVEADWRLRLSYNGPDSGAAAVPGHPNPALGHRHDTPIAGSSVVRLRFGEDGTLRDVNSDPVALGADGSVPDAMAVPAMPVWMEAGRRRPAVLVNEQRRWGRAAGGVQVAATVVEWLPLLDRIRGGNGELELTALRIGREGSAPAAVHGGSVPAPAALGGMVDAAAAAPPARLPRFRVLGTNPTQAEIDDIAVALVARRLPGIRARASIAALADACWQETARLIFRHESGAHGHFDYQPRGGNPLPIRWGFGGFFYGLERGMPTFGPPHGYGIAQLDNWRNVPAGPVVGANPDQVWDFVQNIEQALTILFDDKAAGSFALLSTQPLPAPLDQRFRATHQRETVRRYNGGSEFQFSAAQWRIDPSAGIPAANLAYPNQVLGTGVNYAAARPIAFTAADFGPQTAAVPP